MTSIGIHQVAVAQNISVRPRTNGSNTVSSGDCGAASASNEPASVEIVQGGGYGEHQLLSVTAGNETKRIDAPLVTVRLEPGCGQRLVSEMRRYANQPIVRHPRHRAAG